MEQGEHLYAPLTDTANLVGYTVYPVDVPGFGGEFEIGAERGGQLQNGNLVEPEARFVDTSLTGSRERERDVQQAFYYVADQTGGRALLNAKRTRGLPRGGRGHPLLLLDRLHPDSQPRRPAPRHPGRDDAYRA